MTQTNEQIKIAFEKEFTKKFGAENLELCLVPKMTRDCKFWATEIVTDEVIQWFLSLRSTEMKEVEESFEKYVDENIADEKFNRNWFKAHIKTFFSHLSDNTETKI